MYIMYILQKVIFNKVSLAEFHQNTGKRRGLASSFFSKYNTISSCKIFLEYHKTKWDNKSCSLYT